MDRLPVKNIWFWSPQAQLERSPGQLKNIQQCHKCRNSDCIELIAYNSTTAPTTSQRESNNEHVMSIWCMPYKTYKLWRICVFAETFTAAYLIIQNDLQQV